LSNFLQFGFAQPPFVQTLQQLWHNTSLDDADLSLRGVKGGMPPGPRHFVEMILGFTRSFSNFRAVNVKGPASNIAHAFRLTRNKQTTTDALQQTNPVEEGLDLHPKAHLEIGQHKHSLCLEAAQ